MSHTLVGDSIPGPVRLVSLRKASLDEPSIPYLQVWGVSTGEVNYIFDLVAMSVSMESALELSNKYARHKSSCTVLKSTTPAKIIS